SMSLMPEHELGVFVSFNTDPSSQARSNLIVALIDHFFPVEHLRPGPEVAIDLQDYAGQYVPLRSNRSTFERLGILVNNLAISVQDDALLVAANSVSRWQATAPDRFTARYTDRSMVFERDENGAIDYLLIGSPLNTFKRVRGLYAPGSIRLLIVFAVTIALLAVIGYSYRIFRRAPVQKRLPVRDVFIGWLYALGLLGLNLQLAQTLSGDVEEFTFGVPLATHINLLLMNVNILIGVAVIVFSVRQWSTGVGAFAARTRYSALAVAAIAYTWIAYYFNLIGYLFS
ncbi:MAG: hypothetical protein ACC642_11155, partial [Pseudomonadales bacterium]